MDNILTTQTKTTQLWPEVQLCTNYNKRELDTARQTQGNENRHKTRLLHEGGGWTHDYMREGGQFGGCSRLNVKTRSDE